MLQANSVAVPFRRGVSRVGRPGGSDRQRLAGWLAHNVGSSRDERMLQSVLKPPPLPMNVISSRMACVEL